jgi:hypothetical protein
MQLGFAPLGTSATGNSPDVQPDQTQTQFPSDTIEPQDIPQMEPTDA